MSEEWKFQSSFKGGYKEQDMTNIRGNTIDEFVKNLMAFDDSVVELVNKISSNLKVAGVLAPLTTPLATANTAVTTSAIDSWSPTPPPASTSSEGQAPVCVHGPMKWMEGVSSKTGKPYKFWACTGPRATQCKPVNPK
ncbi:hypothetical protein uvFWCGRAMDCOMC455_03 [Freshwater phage uvFW-CGR-AMD-COM-C455]|nr:hypothetical protein uvFWCGRAMDCOMC455_03 [Freshwater phage uvFW-CGR-AMD-COM-C455]